MNVIDLIKAYLTPEFIAKTSDFIDESDHATSKGLTSVIPIILGGVLNESINPRTISQIWDLILHDDNNPKLLNHDSDLFIENSLAQNQDNSRAFFNLLSGNNQTSLLNEITTFAGFKHTLSASKIATIAGSLVLAFLKKKVTTEAYGVSGLTTWLGGYKKEILEALPSELTTGLLFNNLTSPVYMEPNIDQLKNVDEGGSNWWLWLIALIGLLGLLWSMMKGCNTTEMVDQVQSRVENVNSNLEDSSLVTLSSTKNPDSGLMNSLDSNVRIKWALLGKTIKSSLPGGIDIYAPDKGVEQVLIAFIQDNSKIVDKTTWFNFDRILFESGKSKLNPASMDQINNISSILKAFPSVELKIGGYTDNIGDPKANKILSSERAEAVKIALIEKGIDPLRMSAEGYGQEHAIGDNNTSEGKELNRRVALRVTKK